jgi:transcriptional regulator with XRE-family HTH domain
MALHMTQRRKKKVDPLPKIAEQVRTWRVHSGLNQGELEERAGLAHNAVSRIETEKVCPRLETIEAIAIAIGISVEQLQFKRPPDSVVGSIDELDCDNLVKRLNSIAPDKRLRLLKTFMELLDLSDGES